MNPPLSLEFKLLIITSYEHFPELLLGDVSDEFNTLYLFNLLVIADGNGEQQFVVLAAIQGTGGDIHIHLLRHDRRLVVDGDVLFIDATTHTGLFTDMKEFR